MAADGGLRNNMEALDADKVNITEVIYYTVAHDAKYIYRGTGCQINNRHNTVFVKTKRPALVFFILGWGTLWRGRLRRFGSWRPGVHCFLPLIRWRRIPGIAIFEKIDQSN